MNRTGSESSSQGLEAGFNRQLEKNRQCKTCGIVKLISAYTVTTRQPNSPYLTCKECLAKKAKKWRAENPEKHKEIEARYIKKGGVERLKLKCAKTKERKYGISPERYEAMSAAQSDLCAICRRPETSLLPSGVAKKLAIDHCHRTSKVRALLCGSCNRGLGLFTDRPGILRRAAEYLERHNDTEEMARMITDMTDGPVSREQVEAFLCEFELR